MIPIIFDLDGTLVDSLSSIHAAASRTLADYRHDPLAPAHVATFVGWGERVFVEKMIADTDLQIADFDDVLRVFMGHYAQTSTEVEVFPGVKATLESLRTKGHKTGLCTNKPGVPTGVVLKAAGLDGLLDVVVAGDTLPKRKPDPAPLVYLMEQLGAPRIIYVGDTPMDAETAQRAGVPFALYSEGIRTVPLKDIPHDIAFSHYDAFDKVLAALT